MFQSKIFNFVLILMVVFSLFVVNDSISYWEEDEAAYAGFAWTMRAEGNWANPAFEWSTIHRKTPLHFWLIAASASVFGENSFAVRFPGVMSILLTCFLVWRWGRYILEPKVATGGALILATSLVLPVFAKIGFTDAPLLLCQTAAALALWNFLADPRPYWRWMFWTWIGLGVLVKGPPILILSGGIWFTCLLLHPQRRVLWQTWPWLGLPLALLPFGIWAFCSWQQDGGKLLLFLYDWYIAKRVGGSVLGQTAPPGYHLLVLLISFLPWLPLWIPMLYRFVREGFAERSNLWRYALAWLLWSWVFFEAMSSKLPSYALAAQPIMALLMAHYALDGQEYKGKTFVERFAWGLYALLWIGLPIGLAIWGYDHLGHGYALLLFGMALEWVVLGSLAVWLGWKGRSLGAWRLLALNGAVAWLLLAIILLPIVEKTPIKSLKLVARAAANYQLQQPTAPVTFAGLGLKQTKISLLVYLKQQAVPYELENDLPTAIHRFQQEKGRVWVFGEEGYTALEAAGLKISDYSHEVIEWWSTDNNLKAYRYWVLRS